MPTVTSPPFYPARPVNGGPLPAAIKLKRRIKPDGHTWVYEPKVNGWRALLNTRTGEMWNRHGERLSIAREFDAVIAKIRASPTITLNPAFEWLDVEAFERRHALGRGSLVLLDLPCAGSFCEPMTWCSYTVRQRFIGDLIGDGATPWQFLHTPPPCDELLTFAYSFTDYGISPPSFNLAPGECYPGEDNDGIFTGWARLMEMNRTLKAEVFEGFVAKRADSLYPLQNRSADTEFPGWQKHRWAY
jgi:hypothetical protein